MTETGRMGDFSHPNCKAFMQHEIIPSLFILKCGFSQPSLVLFLPPTDNLRSLFFLTSVFIKVSVHSQLRMQWYLNYPHVAKIFSLLCNLYFFLDSKSHCENIYWKLHITQKTKYILLASKENEGRTTGKYKNYETDKWPGTSGPGILPST